jgi:enoyl-CoA hydratase
MADELVRIERREDGVAVLTLNDPERLNAMSEAMGAAISGAVAALKDDASLRAAVLTGAGRAFSAGGDLDMLVRMAQAGNADRGGPTRATQRAFMGRFYRMYLAVRDLPVPTIAALNGPAIGAGLCVALACDLRIAAREAKLGLNFTKLGIHPGMAATWTLPRIVGHAHAAELIYTGRIIDGEEAARIGLASRAVPREETLAAALALAAEIAAAAPVAVRGAKRSLALSGASDLAAQLDREAAEQALCYESEDLLEGLAAVRDKRTPRFRGA